MAAAAKAKAAEIPRSAFAELLRRSRFSSYDPAIAQTYSAPPASARRGNYGLKRAIPMTYKDSYISVPTFEHHAHFTEWNNAEQQVKFVKRMEELNICPQPLPGSVWHHSLGDTQHRWIVDSDFAQYSPPDADKDKDKASSSPLVSKETPDDLRSLGKQGPGQYGARRPLPGFNPVQVNVNSLSPKQFQHYLSQIRKLGPEFRAYLNKQYRSRRKARFRATMTAEARSTLAEELPDRDLDEPNDFLLFIAAQNPLLKLHRHFLTKQFSENFTEEKDTSSLSAASKIQAQPHRNGGLSYTHTSELQSIITSSPLPGIALQENPKAAAHFTQQRNSIKSKQGVEYLVLLGDFLARLTPNHKKSLEPLYHPNTLAGVGMPNLLESTTNTTGSTNPQHKFDNAKGLFRITTCVFKQLPKVVSYKNQRLHPDELLNEMSIQADVVPDVPLTKRDGVENPHKPGSPYYISHISTPSPLAPSYINSGIERGSQYVARENKRALDERIHAESMGMSVGAKNDYNSEQRAKISTTLKSIVAQSNRTKKGEEDDDEDL